MLTWRSQDHINIIRQRQTTFCELSSSDSEWAGWGLRLKQRSYSTAMHSCFACMSQLTCHFLNGTLTFSWNLCLTLSPLVTHMTMKQIHISWLQMPHSPFSLTYTCIHTLSKITPAPQDRCPLHHRGRERAQAGHITASVMCRAAEWMNQVTTTDDGIIPIKGLGKVMFKWVPVRFKSPKEYMDNDWWRPPLPEEYWGGRAQRSDLLEQVASTSPQPQVC